MVPPDFSAVHDSTTADRDVSCLGRASSRGHAHHQGVRFMKLKLGSERILADEETNPLNGRVHWAPSKSLWIGTMTVLAVALAPPMFSWGALILFITTS